MGVNLKNGMKQMWSGIGEIIKHAEDDGLKGGGCRLYREVDRELVSGWKGKTTQKYNNVPK